MKLLRGLPLLFWILTAVVAGCGETPQPAPKLAGEPGKVSAEAPANLAGGPAVSAREKEVKAEKDEGLKPFDPPPLAELDAKAQWVDQPVKDALQLLRDRQAKEKVLATPEEALSLKNTNGETNSRILSGLGRLPKNDAEVDWDATLNRHTRVDLKTTNQILQSSAIEQEVLGLTGISVIAFDWNFLPFGAEEVVTSWQASQDRLLDKIVLRDDLTWSDGKPLTAHDFVFSFQTIMNPKVPVPAVRSGTDKLRWVQAYDDRTLVFFHKEALATNVWNISFPVLPKHIYEGSVADDPTLQNSPHHVKYENAPVCSGPYVMSKRDRGQEMLLERRESWFMHNGKQVRDKPYFKQIRFRIIEDPNTALLALKNGEIDELMLTPEQWLTRTIDEDFYKLNTKVIGVEWTTFHFGWNLKTPFFSDVRVRKAMSHAFDYKEMHDVLNYGLYEPSNGIFHAGAWMAPKNPKPPYTQDLNKAEELLDNAGWIDHDGDGIRDKEIDGKSVKFEFSILCVNVADRVKYCTLLKENLAQIGINCNVRPLEFTVLQQKMHDHDFQAAFGGWGTGTDPDSSENVWGTGQERNYGHYSNPEVDRLYAAGRREFDRTKRAAIYARIHELMYEDQPVTWLYCRNGFFAFNKQLRGYVFSPRGPYSYSPGINSIWKVKQ